MKCEICGKDILKDSQCINYKYYHNDCIENLQQENKQLKEELKYTVPIVEHNKIVSKKLKENQKYKEVIDKAIEWVKDWTHGANDWFEEDSKPSELLDILKEVE